MSCRAFQPPLSARETGSAAPAAAQPVGGAGFDPASPVAAIVKVPKPWYAPRFVVEGRMRDAVPQFESLPGLDFEVQLFARADGRFGGIDLCHDEASARAWHDQAWQDRVAARYGQPATVEWFETPILQPGRGAAQPLPEAVLVQAR